MKRPLIICGAGGLGREVLSLMKSLPEWEVLGFIDEQVPKGRVVNGMNILGGIAVLETLDFKVSVVVAIGTPKLKADVVGRIDSITKGKIQYPKIIHPSVILQDPDYISIGKGSIVAAGCIVTNNITIGEHCLINLNTTIGHDVVVGNFTSVMTSVNIAGGVNIGEKVLVGSGASIRDGKRIGDECTIGMGAVVTQHISDRLTVVGVPAKPIQ